MDAADRVFILYSGSVARLFQVYVPTTVVALLVSEIFLTFSCFLIATVIVIDLEPQFFLLYEGGLLRIILVIISILLGLYFHDLYTNVRIRSRTLLLQQFCMVIGIAFLAQAFLSYLSRDLMLPRWLMIIGSTLALLAMPAWRMLYSNVVVRAIAAEQVLFVGASSVAREIAASISEKPELGYRTLGFVEDDVAQDEKLVGGPYLGPLNRLREIVEQTRPSRIIVGLSERRGRMPVYDLLQLRLSGILVEEAASSFEAAFGRICIRELRPSQLVFSSEIGPSPNMVTLQSVYSFAIALAGVIITLPIMLLVALAIKLTSRGPVFHRQVRVGKNDRPFTVLKFRSMYADAEARTGAVWAQKDDPRITPVGAWLRRYRLDELPQFFNVLRGEMSIVGPRPERPEFVSTLSEGIPFYRQRHCVRPGITGWAQINYKYGDTMEDTIMKLEYDLYYIKYLSASLDLYIIFNTLKTVLLGRGAQ